MGVARLLEVVAHGGSTVYLSPLCRLKMACHFISYSGIPTISTEECEYTSLFSSNLAIG